MKISDSSAYHFTVTYKVYLDCDEPYTIDDVLVGNAGDSFDFRYYIQDKITDSLAKGSVTEYDVDVTWKDIKDTDDLQVKDFIYDLYVYFDNTDIKGYVESNIYKGESGEVGVPSNWSDGSWYDYDIIDADYEIKLDSVSFA